MRLGSVAGSLAVGIGLHGGLALAEEAPERTAGTEEKAPAATEGETTKAATATDGDGKKAQTARKRTLPPQQSAPVWTLGPPVPEPGTAWLQLVIPDRPVWQPAAPQLVLWLRGPYEDVVEHRSEPLVLSADGDTEYRHTLDRSGTARVQLEGTLRERRSEAACVAGRDCQGRDVSQGVRVHAGDTGFVGVETARDVQGTTVAPLRSLRVVTGRHW